MGEKEVPNVIEKVVFYGVYIPPDVQIEESEAFITVFDDKTEAFKLVKKYKKARFKVFDLYGDAVEFAENGSEYPNISMDAKNGQENPNVGEKHSPFRGPTPQHLVKLRKGIESGDFDFVQKTIWDNPRYLIGSGDTPSILQEGFRYNALHIGARAKNPLMCELILNTIANIKFIKKLYSDDKDPADRAKILLDLYLNTPDKGLHETPLHFAVKFGAPKCVEVLVSFPQCDKSLPNKYGKRPKEIICDRFDGPDRQLFSEQIAMLLEDNYYVPVLRSEDNCAPPSIGEPFSPTSPPNFNLDPLSPRMEIRAYAGPMNKDGAEKFRKLWKTPPRVLSFGSPLKTTSTSGIAALKMKDHEKGLERLGNNLAKKMEVGWREYWPFLDSFIDLASEDGLRLFENYLSERITARYDCSSPSLHNLSECCETSVNENSPQQTKPQTNKQIESPMWELCRALQACTINENSLMTSSHNHSSHSHSFHINNNGDLQHENDQCTLSLTLNPCFCIEKSLQVFAKRISNDIVYLLEGEEETCTLIEGQVKQLQLLMVSYMGDNRFESVDMSRVHGRLAYLIKSLLVQFLQNTNMDNVINRIDGWMDFSSKNYDYSSDDEKTDINVKSQHTLCLLTFLLDFLNNDKVFEDAASENECVNAWLQMKACTCSWENCKVSRKLNGNKRQKFTSLVMQDFPRKLSFEENNPDINGECGDFNSSSSEDDDEDEFFTPPGTPSQIEEDQEDAEVEDDEVFHETQLPDIEIFIEGDFPTKVDYAAFNALKYAECDLTPEDYPNIYRWQHAISLFNEKERTTWASPSVVKYNLNLGSPSITSTPNAKAAPLYLKDIPTPSSPPYTPTKSWLRITGANSPRASASLKHQRGNVSFNL